MVSWQEAIVEVLASKRGSVSIRDLYATVPAIKKTRLDDHAIRHRIRAGLNDLRKDGRVERVDQGFWKISH